MRATERPRSPGAHGGQVARERSCRNRPAEVERERHLDGLGLLIGFGQEPRRRGPPATLGHLDPAVAAAAPPGHRRPLTAVAADALGEVRPENGADRLHGRPRERRNARPSRASGGSSDNSPSGPARELLADLRDDLARPRTFVRATRVGREHFEPIRVLERGVSGFGKTARRASNRRATSISSAGASSGIATGSFFIFAHHIVASRSDSSRELFAMTAVSRSSTSAILALNASRRSWSSALRE